MTITVLNDQSLLDIAIQHTGSAQNAFLIAKENSLSVSAYLVAGYELMIPEGVAFNRDILEYYRVKNVRPATGLSIDSGAAEEELEGIGYWIINKNFKVS